MKSAGIQALNMLSSFYSHKAQLSPVKLHEYLYYFTNLFVGKETGVYAVCL